MDKGRLMVLRSALLAVGLVSVVFLSGCETAKGIGKGLASGFGSAPDNIYTDAHNTWDWLKGADGWMQQNLW